MRHELNPPAIVAPVQVDDQQADELEAQAIQLAARYVGQKADCEETLLELASKLWALHEHQITGRRYRQSIVQWAAEHGVPREAGNIRQIVWHYASLVEWPPVRAEAHAKTPPPLCLTRTSWACRLVGWEGGVATEPRDVQRVLELARTVTTMELKSKARLARVAAIDDGGDTKGPEFVTFGGRVQADVCAMADEAVARLFRHEGKILPPDLNPTRYLETLATFAMDCMEAFEAARSGDSSRLRSLLATPWKGGE